MSHKLNTNQLNNLLNSKTQRYTDYFRATRKDQARSQNIKATFTGYEIKFMSWMNDIEDLVFEGLGLNLLDISDQNYMVMFEEEYSAKEVADYIINGEFNNYF